MGRRIAFVLALALASSTSALAAPARIVGLVDWLPKDAVSVWFSPIDASPLLRFLQSSMRDKPDPCFARQVASLDANVNVQLTDGAAPATLFHGHPNRAALEACLTGIFQRFGPPVTKQSDGAMSTYTQGHGKLYALWTKDWLIVDTNRLHIEDLKRSLGGHTLTPALRERIRLIEPCVSLCVVGTDDRTKALLGVPSIGYALRVQVTGSKEAQRVRVPVSVFFPSAEAARKATTLVQALAGNAKLSAPLQKLMADLKPAVVGSEMQLDVGEIFTSDPKLVNEAMSQLGVSPR
jgi:hypothetical protein